MEIKKKYNDSCSWMAILGCYDNGYLLFGYLLSCTKPLQHLVAWKTAFIYFLNESAIWLWLKSKARERDSHFLMGTWRSSATGALAVAIYGKHNLPYILGRLPQSMVWLSDLQTGKSITLWIFISRYWWITLQWEKTVIVVKLLIFYAFCLPCEHGIRAKEWGIWVTDLNGSRLK